MEEALRSRRKPSRTGPSGSGSGSGWRKLSPSPTRHSRPGLRNPPASRHSWLILDRFVHHSKRLQGVVECDATTSVTSYDCVGRPVRASLRVADSPAVSRLHLHLPGREGIEEDLLEDMEEPSVIAAHRNSILFKVVVPFEKDSEWTDPLLFPIDYFVYSASCSSSSPPSLTRLPVCFEGVASHPEDKYFRPYRRRRQRVMLARELGLLCHGEDGEFTVADLSPHSYKEVELCILHHHHATPPAAAWRVKRLQIPPHMRMMGLNLATFTTDVVLPISSHFLCWVDYYQGLILVDFQPTTDPDQQLSFIPLPPEALHSSRPYIDTGDPDPYRCVSVTNAGIIKFVCITMTRSHSASRLAFTIATWTLDISRGKWRKDSGATMEDGEFFSLYEAGQNLPHVLPSFPVVSMVDPDVISFLLKEDDEIFWMVEVNMWHKKLQSSALYIKEEEEAQGGEEGEEEEAQGEGEEGEEEEAHGEGKEEEEEAQGEGEEGEWEGGDGDKGYLSKKVCRNFFGGHYFIPSQFSAYLSKDAITSWELSDMMQEKVKQRMARQKNGVKAQAEAIC